MVAGLVEVGQKTGKKSGETGKPKSRVTQAFAAGILPERINPYCRKGDSAQTAADVAQYTDVKRMALDPAARKDFSP